MPSGSAGTPAETGGDAATAGMSVGGSSGSGGLAQGGAGGAEPQPVFDREQTLQLMRSVADRYLGQFTNTDFDWLRSTFYAGLMATYRTTRDDKYREAARSWGEANDWAVWPAPSGPRFADNQAAAQTYAELYLDDPTPNNAVMLQPIRAVFDQMVADPQLGRQEWWWCDALFMAPPAMARVAEATNDSAYLNLMHTMWWDTTALLYDPATHLFWRDAKYVSSDTYWSRGNGWVFAGAARVLEHLPEGDAQRSKYVTLLQEMAAALLAAQGSDGFWRSDLLDAEAFPNPESSGTAFFTFGMAFGIHHGLLDRSTYLPAVQKAWAGLTTVALDEQGKIGWVQTVAEKPGGAQESDTRDYAAGAFLLAASELVEL
jgi:rhamnogalacturonyl hydrolase YesR